MSDPSEPDFITSMKGAMAQVVEMAESENRVCYLYHNKTGAFRFSISFIYWKDWIFKAWPGGRKQLSIEGTELLKLEQEQQPNKAWDIDRFPRKDKGECHL